MSEVQSRKDHRNDNKMQLCCSKVSGGEIANCVCVYNTHGLRFEMQTRQRLNRWRSKLEIGCKEPWVIL